MDADPTKVAGVMLEDSVTVTYTAVKDGKITINKATELVVLSHPFRYYIIGSWTEPNPIKPGEMQGMTLNADGTASSIGMSTLIFKSWILEKSNLLLKSESIGNKQRIEGTDTLQIVTLNADSLILANLSGDIVWHLGHVKK